MLFTSQVGSAKPSCHFVLMRFMMNASVPACMLYQGRLPIRVELRGLTRQDFQRILTEPQANLIRQQQVREGSRLRLLALVGIWSCHI